jgi:hypothetical protein
MQSILHTVTAAFLDLQPWSIAIIVPVAGMIFVMSFGLFSMYTSHQRHVMWHQLARLALEKGQPMPEPPSDMPGWRTKTDPANTQERSRGYMIGGLINIAVGTGLFIALSQISKSTAYFAAIPFFIGIALLLGAGIEMLLSRNNSRN